MSAYLTNEIQTVSATPIRIDDIAAITSDFYIKHYMEFLPRYIANGRPSSDTLHTYKSSIDQFLKWCMENKKHPITVQDYQMRLYLQYLYEQKYKDSTLAIKIKGVRAFYNTAIKLGLLDENPVEDISVSTSQSVNDMTQSFTKEQINELLESFQADEPEIRYRNILIFTLMAVEGLRKIEVIRLNREDINWNHNTIMVRGKGHFDYIYPSPFTMNILLKYIESITVKVICDSDGKTPVILSAAKNNRGARITRDGVSHVAKQALKKLGLKHPGQLCHVFRHTAGTNLYIETKDLRLVQDVLRHRDPKTTARYTHVVDKMGRRYTQIISPDVDVN